MADRPILFSGPMVRAILAGTKTQTRRAIKLKPWHTLEERGDGQLWPWMYDGERDADYWLPCPYGQPADRLWVRESLGYCSEYGHYYAADRTFLCSVFDDEKKQTGYSYECDMRPAAVPSIHLPRRWSRITLEVTGVRVERLQAISTADSLAEGIVETCGGYGLPAGEHFHAADPRQSYFSLWETINGPGSVEANPWLWAVSFKRAEG